VRGPGVFRSHGGRSWLVGLCWWRVVVAGGVRPVGASHDPYHQVLASGLDNFLGDHGELVDPQDAFDLADEAAGEAEVDVGGADPAQVQALLGQAFHRDSRPVLPRRKSHEQAAVVDCVFE
jgi:hypothetical protein